MTSYNPNTNLALMQNIARISEEHNVIVSITPDTDPENPSDSYDQFSKLILLPSFNTIFNGHAFGYKIATSDDYDTIIKEDLIERKNNYWEGLNLKVYGGTQAGKFKLSFAPATAPDNRLVAIMVINKFDVREFYHKKRLSVALIASFIDEHLKKELMWHEMLINDDVWRVTIKSREDDTILADFGSVYATADDDIERLIKDGIELSEEFYASF